MTTCTAYFWVTIIDSIIVVRIRIWLLGCWTKSYSNAAAEEIQFQTKIFLHTSYVLESKALQVLDGECAAKQILSFSCWKEVLATFVRKHKREM